MIPEKSIPGGQLFQVNYKLLNVLFHGIPRTDQAHLIAAFVPVVEEIAFTKPVGHLFRKYEEKRIRLYRLCDLNTADQAHLLKQFTCCRIRFAGVLQPYSLIEIGNKLSREKTHFGIQLGSLLAVIFDVLSQFLT